MFWTEEKISKWHKKTFPKATLESQLLKLHEELLELKKCKNRYSDAFLEEVADCLIVASVLAGRFHSPVGNLVLSALFPEKDNLDMLAILSLHVDLKMEKNLRRTWKKERGVYRHE